MRRLRYWLIRRRVRMQPQVISKIPGHLMRDILLDSAEES